MLSRQLRTMVNSSVQLVYSSFGDPNEKLEEKTVELPAQIQAKQLRIRWLAAAMNPSDMAQITGFYPLVAKPPLVGGNEGVARVEEVGSEVKGLSIGDWVIPNDRQIGTWQTQSVLESNRVTKIDNTLPLETAVQTLINPPTAYRMLHDYVELKSGDVVLQNGANSAVGKYVIQMCRLLGYKSVNIVRGRKDPAEQKALVNELTELGADVVVTDEDFTNNYAQLLKPIGFPKLAFDCVTGPITVPMCLALQQDGHLVNYGAVASSNIMVPPGASIFRNVTVHGFWLSGAAIKNIPREKLGAMAVWITQQFKSGALKAAPVEKVNFADWKKAVAKAAQNSGGKQVLVMPDVQSSQL